MIERVLLIGPHPERWTALLFSRGYRGMGGHRYVAREKRRLSTKALLGMRKWGE